MSFANGCVNALSGLYLISTNNTSSYDRINSMECQCPLGLIPHFYVIRIAHKWCGRRCVNALSGLYLISTANKNVIIESKESCVNALSGLYLISTHNNENNDLEEVFGVNALSGLYLISTLLQSNQRRPGKLCQCPLGLIPHFYGTPSKA